MVEDNNTEIGDIEIKVEEVKAEVAPTEVVKKEKKFFNPISINIIVVVILLIIGGVTMYNIKLANQRAEALREAQQAKQAKIEQILQEDKTYMTNLKQTESEISAQTIDLASKVITIDRVWYNAIYNSPVLVNGLYAYDFDTALQYQHDEFVNDGDMLRITDAKAGIQTEMDSLANPSDKNKEAYNSVMTMFSSYLQFETMVESPTGSYEGYNPQYLSLNNTLLSDISDFNTRYANN